MSTTEPRRPITRDDLEAKFRELTGEAREEAVEAGRSLIPVFVAAGVAVVVVAFLLGRRAGRRRSTVVEIRRL